MAVKKTAERFRWRDHAPRKSDEIPADWKTGIYTDIAEIKKLVYLEMVMILALFAFFLGVLIKYFGKF